ncbi:MAG: phosphatidate cytidylyltransferase [Proteobacteria bacterium]|nr:phosphatidate cytidylyltransferase [Pseudomonadota bacterium]
MVYGTLSLPLAVMGGVFSLVLFGAALEWAALAGLDARTARVLYAALTVALALSGAFLAHGHPLAQRAVLIAGCLWWGVAAAWVIHYQWREGPKPRQSAALALCGWLALAPAVLALLVLLERGPAQLLALFALVWGADVFAYFGGKTFGRRRLASHVSPGKTWEGLLAAVVGTQLLALAGAGLLARAPLAAVLALAALTLLASVVGDLTESLLKRLRGVKDSGALLPGHGGLLDRIDSLLAAAPVFTLGLILMEQA